jgi:hypothetical protein
LAAHWRTAYPDLFDEDDERLLTLQPTYHFWEWFVAVHLMHRDGVHALIGKYCYRNHPRKVEKLESILEPSQCEFLRRMPKVIRVQPPDLLVYTPDRKHVGFVEVKGPTDRTSPLQLRSHRAIEARFGSEVEIVRVMVS